MNLKHLRDDELLTLTKDLVQMERTTLTKILHHLREIERRRLYSDLGCASLFEYAVKHLQYSEGQAGRRIQAMRLIKEIPEIEQKIESGALSLSNIAQAQSFFRESTLAGAGSAPTVTREQKLQVLSLLENKSARDGQRELIQLGGDVAIPKERERVLADDKSEVRFVMDQDLRQKLEEVRSLLGPEGAALGFADLVAKLAQLSAEALRAKRFGKRRSEAAMAGGGQSVCPETPTPTPESSPPHRNPRYISQELKSFVWQRDRGACTRCGTRRQINYDHITPVARGGQATAENLRLLCFACNQRAGIRAGLVEIRH